MALPILDGNQSATTLSSILTSGEHIPAHTVVSLGTQAITDISGAVSGSVVSISNFPATQPVSIASVTIGSIPAISGTVTANTQTQYYDPVNGINLQRALVSFIEDEITGESYPVDSANGLPISGTVTANLDANSPIIASQVETGIASYAADLANDPLPISGTVTVGNSVTIGSLPAISGTVTANLSISSTVITSGSFSSLSSATLVPENPARKMATVFNLGAGQLFINAGVTATTLGGGFMVALSSGDFYECDYTTTTLSAIFATAGTASWMSH